MDSSNNITMSETGHLGGGMLFVSDILETHIATLGACIASHGYCKTFPKFPNGLWHNVNIIWNELKEYYYFVMSPCNWQENQINPAFKHISTLHNLNRVHITWQYKNVLLWVKESKPKQKTKAIRTHFQIIEFHLSFL